MTKALCCSSLLVDAATCKCSHGRADHMATLFVSIAALQPQPCQCLHQRIMCKDAATCRASPRTELQHRLAAIFVCSCSTLRPGNEARCIACNTSLHHCRTPSALLLRSNRRSLRCACSAGEDVGHYGGSYKVTYDLYKKFGDQRLLDTPICGALCAPCL